MKYLEYNDLSQFGCLMDGVDIGNAIAFGKLEVYSCKKTNQDKKLALELEKRFKEPETKQNNLKPAPTVAAKGVPIQSKNAFVPNNSRSYSSDNISGAFASVSQRYTNSYEERLQSKIHSLSQSPFGNLQQDPTARTTFIELISLLNLSYPDYDFRNSKPSDFVRHANMDHVFNSINLGLQDILNSQNRQNLWSCVDMIIELRNCEVYSYEPSDESDPMALGDGRIWTWNYFFYNKKLKKVLYFACYAQSKAALHSTKKLRSGTQLANQMDDDDFDEDLDGLNSDEDEDDEESNSYRYKNYAYHMYPLHAMHSSSSLQVDDDDDMNFDDL